MPGSLPTVGRLRAGPWPRLGTERRLDGRPRPAHLSRTARAAATPPPGQGALAGLDGARHRLRRAARRPEGRGRYLKWALSSRRGRPRRPEHAGDADAADAAGSATAAPVYTPPRRTPTGLSRDARTSRAPARGGAEALPSDDGA